MENLQIITGGQVLPTVNNHGDEADHAFHPRCINAVLFVFILQIGGGPTHLRCNFGPFSIPPVFAWTIKVQLTLTNQTMGATN